jgi:hypothetical protein
MLVAILSIVPCYWYRPCPLNTILILVDVHKTTYITLDLTNCNNTKHMTHNWSQT